MNFKDPKELYILKKNLEYIKLDEYFEANPPILNRFQYSIEITESLTDILMNLRGGNSLREVLEQYANRNHTSNDPYEYTVRIVADNPDGDMSRNAIAILYPERR